MPVGTAQQMLVINCRQMLGSLSMEEDEETNERWAPQGPDWSWQPVPILAGTQSEGYSMSKPTFENLSKKKKKNACFCQHGNVYLKGATLAACT